MVKIALELYFIQKKYNGAFQDAEVPLIIMFINGVMFLYCVM